MTKTIARFALAGAAVLSFALPAAPASAEHCQGTFIGECIRELTEEGRLCIPYGTFDICPVDA